MSAVSNTSPLRYFIEIGKVELLPAVLGHVTIPEAVAKELSHASAPSAVRQWIADAPDWLSVQPIGQNVDLRLLEKLDRGESEAIQLALVLQPNFLLIDERLGRARSGGPGIEGDWRFGSSSRCSSPGLCWRSIRRFAATIELWIQNLGALDPRVHDPTRDSRLT